MSGIFPPAAAFGLGSGVYHWSKNGLCSSGPPSLHSCSSDRKPSSPRSSVAGGVGVVAGGSLMGVGAGLFWANGGSILKTLFGGYGHAVVVTPRVAAGPPAMRHLPIIGTRNRGMVDR